MKLPFKDPRVISFFRKTDPIRKAPLQSSLFIEAPSTKDHSQVLPFFTQLAMGSFKANKRITRKPHRLDVNRIIISKHAKALQRKYSAIVEKTSILILVKDCSRTLTDVKYKTKIKSPIKQLSDHIELLDVDHQLLSSCLSRNVKTSEIIDKLKPEEKEPQVYLKLISIPNRSVQSTNHVLDILKEEDPSFKLLSIIINISKSPLINKEISELLDLNKNDESQNLNYESLLRIARESHAENQNLTKGILTKIGQLGFVEVEVNQGSLSFIKK